MALGAIRFHAEDVARVHFLSTMVGTDVGAGAHPGGAGPTRLLGRAGERTRPRAGYPPSRPGPRYLVDPAGHTGDYVGPRHRTRVVRTRQRRGDTRNAVGGNGYRCVQHASRTRTGSGFWHA